MLEIRADHSTLPRLSSLVTRVGTRSEREQLLARAPQDSCASPCTSIGARGAIKTAYDVILQTAPIVVHGGAASRHAASSPTAATARSTRENSC